MIVDRKVMTLNFCDFEMNPLYLLLCINFKILKKKVSTYSSTIIFRSQLKGLQQVQITELEAEFAKVEDHKVTPTRYLRSQQEKQAKLAIEAVDGNGKGHSLD